MNTDSQLLKTYAESGSECAFRELVERHINLVHSAAFRESHGNAAQAEDITQAVFSELARRAATLAAHPALSGGLYTCVRRMTANVRRTDERLGRWRALGMGGVSASGIGGDDAADACRYLVATKGREFRLRKLSGL